LKLCSSLLGMPYQQQQKNPKNHRQLKQQVCISLLLRDLEIQDQGSSKVDFLVSLPLFTLSSHGLCLYIPGISLHLFIFSLVSFYFIIYILTYIVCATFPLLFTSRLSICFMNSFYITLDRLGKGASQLLHCYLVTSLKALSINGAPF
jgi:hypothetical protein